MASVLISVSPIAIAVLDEDGKLLHTFPQLGDELNTTLQSLSNDNQLICDYLPLKEELSQSSIRLELNPDHPILRKWRLTKFSSILENIGQVEDYNEYRTKIRQQAMESSYDTIKAYASQPDELIAQVVLAIDDLQKTINLMGNRLSELYSLHFPELVETLSNQVTLARLVVEQPSRQDFNIQSLHALGIPREKIDYIESKINHSLGGDLSVNDIEAMKLYAQTILNVADQKVQLEKWIDHRMETVAPNITAVAGANVGARLISAMGSLENLAKTHSSKVQIIGAEKALYSAMRGRGSPPKHGIIFQIPEIGNSPYWIRGKLARAFAAKIVIAARLDYFNGEFIGDKLRNELREIEVKAREKYPEPKGGNN